MTTILHQMLQKLSVCFFPLFSKRFLLLIPLLSWGYFVQAQELPIYKKSHLSDTQIQEYNSSKQAAYSKKKLENQPAKVLPEQQSEKKRPLHKKLDNSILETAEKNRLKRVSDARTKRQQYPKTIKSQKQINVDAQKKAIVEQINELRRKNCCADDIIELENKLCDLENR